jgi:hypothetical protein
MVCALAFRSSITGFGTCKHQADAPLVASRQSVRLPPRVQQARTLHRVLCFGSLTGRQFQDADAAKCSCPVQKSRALQARKKFREILINMVKTFMLLV